MTDLHWKTAITKVEPNEISIRGYRLDDLIGKVSYSQMVYLLFKGEMPPQGVERIMEAILVSSIDHGTSPPSALSAITVASTGASLNASVAAGILAISKFHGGAIEECMVLLKYGMEKIISQGSSIKQAVQQVISEYRNDNKRLSGFGHRLHSDDPRTNKLFTLADECGISRRYIQLIREFETELTQSLGKKLPINVDGAIAALLCELDFDPILANAFFMIARVPGLVAHIYEENTRYKPMRKIHPTDVEYDGPEERGW